MSVKRYSPRQIGSGIYTMMNESCGEFVKHEDYAALEQKLIESERYGRQTDITIDNLEMKLAQIAAENAGLKSVDVWMNADEVGGSAADKAIENGATPEEATRAGVQAVIESIKTPVTDAFMAEVRAQGVDMFGQYHNFSEKLFIQKEAQKFAAQLRKGVQS